MARNDFAQSERRGSATRRLALAVQMSSALGSCLGFASSADGREPPPVVRVQDGWLQGTRLGGVERFLAIPYAAPPVGSLRFRPPAAVAPWRGLRSAETLPPRCLQLGGGGEEDCLYLNVYRPSRPRRLGRLPVLFFIHGGGLKVGSSIDNDPSRIAASTDTIVVMINYRLGQLGFLAHPALGEEAGDGASGEYGLMDQQAALGWVKQRIAAFGGDPDNVTIAGGSAGGWSVCAHLTSDPVEGLFSGAVIQSGGCYTRPLEEAEALGVAFAEAAGCPDTTSAACLREKSAADLLASDSWARESVLVSGGRLLPEAPSAAVAGGRFHHVPVLIGGTRNELRQALTGLYPMTEQAYVGFVNDTFGELGERILDVYPSAAYPEPFDALAEVLNDSGVAGGGSCVSRREALTFAEHVPTYVYEFDDPNAPVPTWVTLPAGMELGSSHGSDEVYWFDRPFDGVAPLNEPQSTLAHEMIQYLGAFVERGVPRVRRQPHFPRFGAAHERVLRFRPDAVSVRTDFADEHHCDFWSSLGY